MAARIRNDAVGTVVVAAVLYLEQGAGVSRQNTGGQLLKRLPLPVVRDRADGFAVAHCLFAQIQHGGAVGCAADNVHAVHGGRLLRFGLREAAAQRDNRVGILFLQFM